MTEFNSTHQLKPYPFDWKGLETFDYPRDSAGIPMVEMGKAGLKYNPITISQLGLFSLQRHSKKASAEALAQAQICVRWLCANFQAWHNDIGAWVYNFDLDFYGPKAPWISGMAQGQGISLLLRAHQIEPEDSLPGIAERAFQAFLHTVSDGGVLTHLPDGTPFFEEFTTTPPSCVLNGHMFALLGIFDYAEFFRDGRARALFTTGAKGLAKNLYRYDTGFWNLYDLHSSQRLASPMYLNVHVRLLRILADITGEQTFYDYSERWMRYQRSFISRLRWLTGKVNEKIRLRD